MSSFLQKVSESQLPVRNNINNYLQTPRTTLDTKQTDYKSIPRPLRASDVSVQSGIRMGEQASAPEYKVSPISGGAYPIYNFECPADYLYEKITSNDKDALVYYFAYLYPMTPVDIWKNTSTDKLISYYENLDFWYTFNPSWGVSPMPVLLSYGNNILEKWEKNTFFQAGTVVQTSITSWGRGMNNAGEYEWLAARMNNAPQNDASLTYKMKNGTVKTITTVSRDKDYWPTMIGKKMEITSWGWNPYPYGIYSQGPFKGTGNFLEISKKAIVGTAHWTICRQVVADGVSDITLWTALFNHELMGQVPMKCLMGYKGDVDCTPWIIIKKLDGTWEWSHLQGDKGGLFPLLVTYFCFIMGGFGGIGDPWVGNYGPFFGSWDKGYGKWQAGWKYAPIFVEQKDGSLIFPEDQSVPGNNPLPNTTFSRPSSMFWEVFGLMFSMMEAWDTNWVTERWRHNIFWSSNYNNIDIFKNTAPSTMNLSDDIMMAMVTGNFTILGPNPGHGVKPSLSKFSNNPHKWSHTQLANGTVVKGSQDNGTPIGWITHYGDGYDFVVRSQMPNVNGDLCAEFADFRVCTPGNLALGTGDQKLWVEFFSYYGKKFMYTMNPFDESQYHNFDGDFAPVFPDVKLKTVNLDKNNWKTQENVCTNKTFVGFDVFSGKDMTNLAFTGKSNEKYTLFDTYPGMIGGNGVLSLEKDIPDCSLKDPTFAVTPTPIYGNAAEMGGNLKCYENKNYPCKTYGCGPVRIATEGQSYYPFATDNFDTGMIGNQGDGFRANLGACQTRWSMSSKGITWKFNAPLANRLILKTGMRHLKSFPAKNYSSETNYVPFYIGGIILLLVLMFIHNKYNPLKIKKKPVNLILGAGLFLIISLWIYNQVIKSNKAAKNKLKTYLTLVYPMSTERWKDMSLGDLETFFCSLHHWYKGDGLPSPKDYLKTSKWKNAPPFGKGSKWQNFTTRKHCIVGAPQAYSEIDNNLEIGYDDKVGTTSTETPTGILFRGRQLLSRAANVQKSTFMEPSYNFHIDTFNSMSSVNDTSMDSWKKVRYIEVSSQWGPFPDGIYFDWAQGTGVWMDLGNHIVGYNGLDVCRRAGMEVQQKINSGDKSANDQFRSLWQHEWQLTGLDNMLVDGSGNIYQQTTDPTDIYGYYGTVIMTKTQYNQIDNAYKAGIWGPKTDPAFQFLCADGELYSTIASYIDMQYYNVDTNKWQSDMPSGGGYVLNYPFPLPFGSDKYTGDSNGFAVLNDNSLKMPWKYQLFNMAMMTRYFVITALFLDEYAIPLQQLTEKRADFNFVDIVIANKKNRLKTPRTWEQAIEVIIKLLQQPIAHPFFSLYNRTVFTDLTPAFLDGPLAVLRNPREWSSGTVGVGTPPALNRVQTGVLDKKMYLQDTVQSKGVLLSLGQSLPQLYAADLEIDHWMAILSKTAGYDTVVRIQHWCGNKNLSYDIEIIDISNPIAGNLGTNTLYTNIYDVWKGAISSRFSVRDPFYETNSVYPEVYQDIDTKSSKDKSEVADWNKPPWIGYYPKYSFYGWAPQDLASYTVQQRLSYCPASSEQVGFSASYPEYNGYIMDHFSQIWK